MKSISFRFALASVSVALFVLAITGSVNYFFLKEELLSDATQKAKLIEENSVHKIQTIISQTKESSQLVQNSLIEENFTPNAIREILTKTLQTEPYFYGMAVAFEPKELYPKAFSPYYYKKESTIVYTDLAKNNYNYQSKEWYTTPKKEKKASWSEPYFDEGGGEILMATYSNPIIINNKFVGVSTIDLSLKNLQKFISSIHILESGYAFLLSREHKILVYPESSKILQTYHKKNLKYNQIIKEGKEWIYYAHVASSGLTLGIVLPSSELFSSLHRMSFISTMLALIGAILLIITMLIISRRITQPLKDVTALTEEISLGNFDKKITLPKYRDEIYYLSLSINRMQDSIKQYIRELKTATIEQQKVESELSIAKNIQMSMLPKPLKRENSIDVEAFLQPAKAVGGDFYDFFYIDDTKLCFIIADVSGKGIPASLFMSVTMSYIRAYSSKDASPKEVIEKLNNTMTQNNDANMFVTLFFAILDTKSGELHFVNAGHTEPYIISKKETLQALSSPKNPIVGAFEGIEYVEESIKLKGEEKLFLYTDGVNEAYSKEDEQFSEERLKKLLTQSKNLTPKEIIQKIYDALLLFCQEYEQSDDITMLCIEFNKKETL